MAIISTFDVNDKWPGIDYKDLQFFDAKFGLCRYQITKSIFGHLQSIWHVFKRYDELTPYSLCVMNQLINKS